MTPNSNLPPQAYPPQPNYAQMQKGNGRNNTSSPNGDPYYIAPKDSFKVTTKRTKFIEFLMIAIPIVVGATMFTINFDAQTKDNQKQAQIDQVIAAVRLFYTNSSNVEATRVYPIALSSSMNEVDYEYTLQRSLTGLTTLDRHAYIQPENFPTDPWGTYSQNFTDRPVAYNRLEKLPFPTSQNMYTEGFKSCNFQAAANGGFPRCYLYSSSVSGDTFSLGYYSESRKSFVVHTESRNNSNGAVITYNKL